MKVTGRFLYGEDPAEVESAAGVKGVLIRTIGGAMLFRVYETPKRLTVRAKHKTKWNIVKRLGRFH
jgi:hypothetical protein